MYHHAKRRAAAAAAILAAAIVVAAALTLAACGSSDAGDAGGATPAAGSSQTAQPASSPPSAQPSTSPPSAQPSTSPAAGSKIAPGLYDLGDGALRAVGTVEHRDLEGGFWAVVGESRGEGDEATVVAVIANGDDFADQFRANEGASFVIDGKSAGDASIRMAGPEITATKVTLASELGPAQ